MVRPARTIHAFNRVRPRHAETGKLLDQHEPDSTHLSRTQSATTEEDTETQVKDKLRDDSKVATMPNETWAMDFVHDQLATGRKLRILTIVDTYSRYAPAIDPRFSYRAEDVVRTLEGICRKEGYPRSIRVDQGSEFISRDFDL